MQARLEATTLVITAWIASCDLACNNKGVLVLTVQISTRCTAEIASLGSLHAHATLSISASYCHIQQDCFPSMKLKKGTSLQIPSYCILTAYCCSRRRSRGMDSRMGPLSWEASGLAATRSRETLPQLSTAHNLPASTQFAFPSGARDIL